MPFSIKKEKKVHMDGESIGIILRIHECVKYNLFQAYCASLYMDMYSAFLVIITLTTCVFLDKKLPAQNIGFCRIKQLLAPATVSLLAIS